MKKFLKYSAVFAGTILPVAAVVSCAPTRKQPLFPNEKLQQKNLTTTNQKIDPTKYGVATLASDIITRTLLFPAARGENGFNSEGVFRIGLHHRPTRGITGDWIAIATEVVGEHDNTLSNIENPVVKTAKATARTDVSEEHPTIRKLQWEFTGENALTKGKWYTFIFYKTDGTEKIVFSNHNINNSLDTFN
ncbi:hypothetical protein EG856_00410 [Mycoplasmopsis phocirhinis]|uniref:Lipoprotein n=1 Tax=Mycoplasmopsis phocirhinis TaxID=142650 RepID=A0A4P6MNE3_9BACT|nr:hypothetical protein [Mycoplasmopsis phocirhinis]QBF34400.1 hypothetical protein EG856_00410 [Mycoplasmopsis phocirhinis]